jgi:hypothetical protein
MTISPTSLGIVKNLQVIVQDSPNSTPYLGVNIKNVAELKALGN